MTRPFRPPLRARPDANTGGGRLAAGAATGLSLSATPVFAAMATLALDADALPLLCATAPDGPAAHGMATMYVLMSLFHLAPWLRLLAVVGRPPPARGRADERDRKI